MSLRITEDDNNLKPSEASEYREIDQNEMLSDVEDSIFSIESDEAETDENAFDDQSTFDSEKSDISTEEKMLQDVDSDKSFTETDDRNANSSECVESTLEFDNSTDLRDDESKASGNEIEQEQRGDNLETGEAIREITSSYYNDAKELALNNEDGRTFTDHKEDHVEMVADKSLEAGSAIKEAVENGNLSNTSSADRVGFGANIDNKTLEGAALSHDTGMSGNGYALNLLKDENGNPIIDENGKVKYEKDDSGNYQLHHETNSDFKEVRSNHSLNSSINVLTNRDQYKEAGCSDEQIDKIAAECMAHSKSSSGVADLNSKEDWSDCFDRIDATVSAYNTDHPDNPISFDRSVFENDDEKLASLASETLALRIGDVSRDSFAGAEAQSGENVYVDRSTIDDHAGSISGELAKADISIGENGDPIKNSMSRQVHAGEQNISDNHTFVGENGNLTHEITVADGVSAPTCTREAIMEHLGELASACDGRFDVNVEFDKPCDEFSKNSYESFRKKIYLDLDYKNVNIHYPWDEEE